MVKQEVENGDGQNLIAERGAAMGDELVGRVDIAAAFVPPGDELEDQVRPALLERPIAEFVNTSSLGLAEASSLSVSRRRPRRGRAHRGARPRWRTARVTMLDGGAAECDGEVSLANAGRAEQQHVHGVRGVRDEASGQGSRTIR